MKDPLVYIVILNYNGMRWVQPCFETLRDTRYRNFRILFVDNNSSDASVAFVRAHFPEVEIVLNDQNLGFSEGNNVGTRRALSAGADYVVLLNTDTKVTPDWLIELVKVGEEHSNVGILGGIELDYSGAEFNEWTLGRRQKYLAELGDSETARQWIPTDWVHGSCFAIKRKVIEDIGMLDPIYFMYCEETDYCRRATAHGYEVAIVPRSRYHHYGGGSSKGSRRAQFLASWRLYRSVMIYHATDLNLSFAGNLLNYSKMLFKAALTAVKERKFGRIVLVIGLQAAIVRRILRVARKWKNDRSRMLSGRGNPSFGINDPRYQRHSTGR